MKLLFDQNISPKLVHSLSDIFPGSKHVSEIGMEKASDAQIWEWATENNFNIVTKDTDFLERRILLAKPPNIILVKKGNCSTFEIEYLLRNSITKITRINEKEAGVIILR